MTKIYKPHLSNINPKAQLGKQCVIHSQVWISDGVIIGDRVRIQAFTFIPYGVTLEDDVFIGPGVVFTNDPNMELNRDKWLPTLIKKGAKIGANATIKAGVVIRENAIIGMGAVVLHDVGIGETWYGNPARKA